MTKSTAAATELTVGTPFCIMPFLSTRCARIAIILCNCGLLAPVAPWILIHPCEYCFYNHAVLYCAARMVWWCGGVVVWWCVVCGVWCVVMTMDDDDDDNDDTQYPFTLIKTLLELSRELID